jgi:outer membrane immunogenic protein
MLMSTVGLMALAASSGIGLAADLMVETPIDVPASMFDWGGAYAGVVIGGGQTNVDFDDDANDAQLEQSSLAAFVVAGFNWVDGSLLYGVEGDLGIIRGSGDVADQFDNIWSDNSLNAVVGTLRGRVGYATENLLLYGTAGLAVTSDDLDLDYWSADAVRVGAVVGVGVEVAVTESMSLKAEGRYYAFGEGEAENDGYTYTSNTAVGLVGLNFHF